MKRRDCLALMGASSLLLAGCATGPLSQPNATQPAVTTNPTTAAQVVITPMPDVQSGSSKNSPFSTNTTSTESGERPVALKPNPVVGCVIADGGRVLGEGWHERAGEPHAEVMALRAAGGRAAGATAYVTLEPCAHHGRTPPCADALVAAGVTRVVAACRDPFYQVAGQGFAKLAAAGITVEHGLMEAAARHQNRGFISRIERGRPWVRVKLGMSLDGRTALEDGVSKWITSDASRADVMRWRARAGAIMTGIGTVLADDPRLTVRLAGDDAFVPPLRVVLDERGCIKALNRYARQLFGVGLELIGQPYAAARTATARPTRPMPTMPMRIPDT